MTYEEAVDVLEAMSHLYPGRFEVTKRRAEIFIPQLEKMVYEGVLAKLTDYALDNPFPPTLSDIAVYPPKENEYLARMKQWEEEAAKVPQETKALFQKKFDELVRRLSQ
ncbi:hypothetical protein [Halobacillus massiliensis]|uniref:hypothetical protein n=1 Tax=Halobacillus massiliensis TaxID=1926286 RepID=UPI0009E3FDD3|nr:hypothetical protein [Halobacillus massiliensis]